MMPDARKVVVWTFVSAAVVALVLGGWVIIAVPGLILGGVVATVLHFTQRDVMPAREDARGDWGPNMSRISFSGVGGLIFVVGSMAILFVGVPPLRWFLGLSVPLGICVGLGLHWAHHD